MPVSVPRQRNVSAASDPGDALDTDATDTDASAMFNAGGSAVQKDGQGRAAVTVDFVCLRCHNQAGNVFPLTLSGARLIADGMHERAAEAE